MCEEDLFRQVAQTYKGLPITKEQFNQTLDYIEKRLELSSKDHLLDMCCGNGLISYELAAIVKHVTGIDFVPRNIRIALEQRSSKNTTYVLGDVTSPLSYFIGIDKLPCKFLMNGSLAYFEPKQFDSILHNISQHLSGRPFLFLLTSIPCYDLR